MNTKSKRTVRSFWALLLAFMMIMSSITAAAVSLNIESDGTANTFNKGDTIYFDINSKTDWTNDGAKLAAIFFYQNNDNWCYETNSDSYSDSNIGNRTAFSKSSVYEVCTPVEGNTYKVTVPADSLGSVRFIRVGSNGTDVWNYSSRMSVDSKGTNNCVAITDWDNTGKWTTFKPSSGGTPGEVTADLISILNGTKINFYYGDVWGSGTKYLRTSTSTSSNVTDGASSSISGFPSSSHTYYYRTAVASPAKYYVSNSGSWEGVQMSATAVAGAAYVLNNMSDIGGSTNNVKAYTGGTKTVSVTVPETINVGSTLPVTTGAVGKSVINKTNQAKYYILDGSTYKEATLKNGALDTTNLKAGTYTLKTLLTDGNIYVLADTDKFTVGSVSPDPSSESSSDPSSSQESSTESTVPSTMRTLYFDATGIIVSDANARYAIYAFDDSKDQKEWVSMTNVKGNIFKAEIPKSYPNVIFVRLDGSKPENIWENKWNQSENLDVTDEYNLYTSIAFVSNSDKFTGKWGKYTEDPIPSSGEDPTKPTDPPNVDPVKASAFQNAIWFDVQPETPGSTSIIGLVKAYDSTSGMRFYIPSGIDTKNLHIYHSYNKVVINGTEIKSGGTYDVSAWTNTTVKINDGSSKSFKVYKSTAKTFLTSTFKTDASGKVTYSDLPTTTDEKLTSKSSVNKSGTYVALNSDGSVLQNLDTLSSIKGRGNSSWEASYQHFGKYAYNLKLNSKIKLADNSTKSKKWSFLANNADESMMRNTVVYNLGDSVGLEDSPMGDIYDVYNNGNYLGTYLASEKVEVGGSALVNGTSIDDLNEEDPENAQYDFDNPTRAYKNGTSIDDNSTKGFYKYNTGMHTPENFKTGDFLLEFELSERFADEMCGFISNQGQQVVLKTPEVATQEEVRYIMDRFNAAEAVAYVQSGGSSRTFAAGKITVSGSKYTYTSTLEGSNYTVTVDSYDKLIDAESFAQNYLIQEFVENLDGVATSFYVNLSNEDSIFTASPLWDFDWTLGQYGNDKKIGSNTSKKPNNTDQWFIKEKGIYGDEGTKNFVARLNMISDFWTRVQLQWKYNVYPQVQKLYGANGLIKGKYSDMIRASITMNEDRYHFIANDPIKSWGSVDTGATWDAAVSYLDNWAMNRAKWMNSNIGSAAAYTKTQDASATISIEEGQDTITADVTAQGISGTSALKSSDYTYRFTVKKGEETRTVTQVGNPKLTVATEYSTGDVFEVSVEAYPTLLGRDTGFVLSATETYTVLSPSTPSLTLKESKISIYVGKKATLTAKAVNIEGELTWESDNQGVATVDKGVVTALSEGVANIKVSGGGLSATCVVTVTEEPEIPSTMVTVYFTNNKNWSKVNAYIWNDTTKDKPAEWPGKAINKITTNEMSQDIYAVTFDSAIYDSVIFNDGTNQTVDIKGIKGSIGYYIDTADTSSPYDVKSYEVVEPALKLSENVVSLKVGGTYKITPKKSVGTLSYTVDKSGVVSVSKEGLITADGTGTAVVTVTAKGTFTSVSEKITVSVSSEPTKATVNGKEYPIGTVITFIVRAQFDEKLKSIQGNISYSKDGLEVQEGSFAFGNKIKAGSKIFDLHDTKVVEGSDVVSYNCLADEGEYNLTKLSTLVYVQFKVKANGEWTISNKFTLAEDINGSRYVDNGETLKDFDSESEVADSTPAPDKYTVEFKNYDGSVISSKEYNDGEDVEIPTDTPTRPDDQHYTYTFSGWEPTVDEKVTDDAVYTAKYSKEAKKYNVSVSVANGTVTGCPEEAVEYGTSVTLNAKADEGYTFVGFFVDGHKVSPASSYTFTVEKDIQIEAKFEAKPSSELKVMVLGGDSLKVKIGSNGTEAVQSVFYFNRDVKTGQYITLTAGSTLEGFKFMYWIDENGIIVSYNEKYTFMFMATTNLTAVYAKTTSGVITFMSGYHQTNSSMCYENKSDIVIPTPYGKSGYTFKFWSIDGVSECTVDDIYEASLKGNVNVEALYEADEVYYSVNVESGTIISVDGTPLQDTTTSGSYKPTQAIKVKAEDAPDGQKFAYWQNEKGEIVFYNEYYEFYLSDNHTYTAVFVDENEEVESKAIVAITSKSYDESTKKFTTVAEYAVPTGCTIVTAGTLLTTDTSVGTSPEGFTVDTAEVKSVKDYEESGYDYLRRTVNKGSVNYGDIWFARAYLVYRDANGNIYEVYGDIISNEDLF